ncbi:DUF294 nucleotidyltransferase-like domain-containing protein [Paenibacillus koleovorans]|uniref:DUF294 nucleotidyltransferase-like domain-containing protein n=1 Tax=Paenibacillus koleovorans TaxID=121608 RepID=UPI000FDABD12|nr:DUF294 nucleotidyltransferase-like domain-containing protein [Paenibacillus koleovorans]
MEGYNLSHMENSINRAVQVEELRSLREQMLDHFPAPPAYLHIGDWYSQLNRLHDQFIRRTLILSERKLREEGRGSPPVPYTYVVVGSGGRSEQTQWSDQDNGLVYADPGEAGQEAASLYFELLSEEVFLSLQQIGYPPCEGNVICTNPQWRKPLSQWLRMLREWFNDPTWENVRYLLIVFDLRGLHGVSLAAALKEAFAEEVRRKPGILGAMLRNTLHHKPSLGPFGNLITERYGPDAGGLDIKYGSYIPLINGIRLLSIMAGVQETSSRLRLGELAKRGFITEEHAQRWNEALQFALWLRTQTPYQSDNGIYSTRGIIQAEQLSRELKQRLRRALRDGHELQQAVRKRAERLLVERGDSG